MAVASRSMPQVDQAGAREVRHGPRGRTSSSNLRARSNRRRLFSREAKPDTFKRERIPSTYSWEYTPKGQHLELGIAEMNLFIMLSALGLSHSLFGERLIPIGTLYDLSLIHI